jgi:hypothetical protein
LFVPVGPSAVAVDRFPLNAASPSKFALLSQMLLMQAMKSSTVLMRAMCWRGSVKLKNGRFGTFPHKK